MLNKLVTLKLDKERHLKLGMRGLMEFEEITGKSLLKGFKLDDLTLKDTAALVWATLIHEDKELQLDDVIDMLDVSNITEALNAVKTCITNSFPKAEKSRPLPQGKSHRG